MNGFESPPPALKLKPPPNPPNDELGEPLPTEGDPATGGKLCEVPRPLVVEALPRYEVTPGRCLAPALGRAAAIL
jgi:hypothetical protein